ncbi:uncharacterized protein LOC135821934 [Sycon ciliatum]|uniref:uncharacterized protein LOC135821934 n=1 Tax=Sycon ciliatum TaxID=27933 RepID=UPI0031F68607
MMTATQILSAVVLLLVQFVHANEMHNSTCQATNGKRLQWIAPADGQHNLASATEVCGRMGYVLFDFSVFTDLRFGLRRCVESMLKDMAGDLHEDPVDVWTSFVHRGRRVVYRQGLQTESVRFDASGSSDAHVVCVKLCTSKNCNCRRGWSGSNCDKRQCNVRGKLYDDGDEYSYTQGNAQCTPLCECRDGRTHCPPTPQCPSLPCPPEQRQQRSDGCCDECMRDWEQQAITPPCSRTPAPCSHLPGSLHNGKKVWTCSNMGSETAQCVCYFYPINGGCFTHRPRYPRCGSGHSTGKCWRYNSKRTFAGRVAPA